MRKTTIKKIKKALTTLKKLRANKTFMNELHYLGYKIDVPTVNSMEKYLKEKERMAS
jgi:translation elongation factor P/translation initiation factor 5A